MYDNRAIKFYENGRKLQQAGRLADAERAYRKAVKINPNFFEAHNNLGNVQMETGRLKQAVASYRNALQWLPHHPMLLNNLGNALQLQGRNEQAVEQLRKALRQQPDYADAHNNLGNALHALGENSDAIAAYREAIRLDGQMVDALTNLGNTLLEEQDNSAAIESFRRAIQVQPRHHDAWHGLGNALRNERNFDAAADAYREAISIDPRQADTHEALARTLSLNDKNEAAIAAFREALALDPAHLAALRGLGSALGFAGEMDEAIATLREALRSEPSHGNSLLTIAKFKQFTEAEDADLLTMESLYARDHLSDEDRIPIGYGLGKAYEDLREYRKSITCILDAAARKHRQSNYSRAQSEALFDSIKSTFTPEFSARFADCGNPDPTPVFILGMPRSGTTLAEQILASHPDVYGAGELRLLWDLATGSRPPDQWENAVRSLAELSPEAMRDIGDTYLDGIRKISPDARFITDKLPHNFMFIGLIRTLLPNAKILHMQRDPVDNCLSIFKTLFAHGHEYSYDLEDLGHYYRLYLDLMDYWQEVFPGKIYPLGYEALVTDPKQQIADLLEHCDLPWNDACMQSHETRRTVRTASNAQVIQPIHQRSVKLSQRYASELQPLIEALG